MRGLIVKSLRETWGLTLFCGVAIMAVVLLLNLVLPLIFEGINDVLLKLPFVKMMSSALLGTDIGDEVTPPMLQAIVWVHPVTLAIFWTHAIVYLTRVPAGEIDRGSIDVLLSWPVSRRALYASETIAWLASGLCIFGMALIGTELARWWIADAAVPPRHLLALIALNLLGVYLASGAVAMVASAASDRRSRAVTIVLIYVFGSFLVNFVAQFWPPAEPLAFLSVTRYYEPAQVLLQGQLAWGHIAVLGVGAGVAWVAGGEILARRSMCTV
jgi:ABC-type Na+ efflux pump permease subunit